MLLDYLHIQKYIPILLLMSNIYIDSSSMPYTVSANHTGT